MLNPLWLLESLLPQLEMVQAQVQRLPATTFTDDTGAAATAFPGSFAYYVLYLNAQIQTADVSTLTTTTITIPDGNTLDPATPVVVEVVVN